MKLAFVYPGQGSQRVGMGSELRTTRPELFESYLGRADAASGLPISRICLEGPAEVLIQTQVAQPALFALSLALTQVAVEHGLRPDFVAGHSLGEYVAAVISGAVDWEAGLELVVERGRLMAQIQQRHPGSMAAIVGIRPERLVALCETASECGLVTVANLNSPMQSVVAGDPAAVERVIALARAAGAKATMRLQVGAAFHTPRMQPVRAQLAERMEGVRWRDPAIPMVANASGTLLTRGDEVKHALLAQIVCPVQWIACVTTLRDAGCTRFLQLGPGRVVSGLVRQIDREVDAVAAESPSRIARLAREHAEAT